jgi:hypothetical protein
MALRKSMERSGRIERRSIDMKTIPELPGIDLKLYSKLFQCSEVEGIFSHAATALIFSLLLSFASRQKKVKTTQQNTTTFS